MSVDRGGDKPEAMGAMMFATTGQGGVATAMPRALFAVLLIAMIGPALLFVTMPPSLPMVADYFGGGAYGASVAQDAIALSFLGGAIGGLLAGFVIAVTGLRGALVGAAALYALGGAFAMAAHVPAALFAGCFTVGLMGALLSSGLAMATGAVLTGEARTKMLGFQAATSDVCGIMIGLTAGVLAQFAGWRGPLAIYIAFGVTALVLVLVAKPQARQVPQAGGGMLLVLRKAWPVYACGVLLCALIGTQQIQLPFHLAAHGLTSAGPRALVQTCFTIAASLGSLTFGYTRARFGEPRQLLAAGASAATGFVVFALWKGGLVPACAASAAVGVAIGVGIPMLFTAALRITPPASHGYAIGVLNTSIFAGGALSPVLFGPVMTFGGAPAVFAVCAVVAAVTGIFLTVVIVRRSAKQVEAAPESAVGQGNDPHENSGPAGAGSSNNESLENKRTAQKFS